MKHALLCVTLLFCSTTYSMDKALLETTDTDGIVRGDLGIQIRIDHIVLRYAGAKAAKLCTLGIPTTETEALVAVFNTIKDGALGYNVGKIFWKIPIKVPKKFPKFLPLRLLEDKKEGEVVKFVLYDKSIELVCKQNGHYPGMVDFQTYLQYHKEAFRRLTHYDNEHYTNDEKKMLLDKGVLDKDSFGYLTHGPNGFILEE